MQSPKTLLTTAALGALLLSSTAAAQIGTPQAHLAASTQGIPLQTTTVTPSSGGLTGTAVGAASAASPQSRPDLHKAQDMGKAPLGSTTVQHGQIATDAKQAGKNAPAKPQSRPDLHKAQDMGKFGKPSKMGMTSLGSPGNTNASQASAQAKQPSANAQPSSSRTMTAIQASAKGVKNASPETAGNSGGACQILDVLEDSAATSGNYAAGPATVRTQARAEARILRDATDASNLRVLKGELRASLTENISLFGLSANTSRISVAASREMPQGNCGTVTARSAGARIELGGTTVQILRAQGDALLQGSIERITLDDRTLVNAGPIAILVAPLVSTRADLSIEAGSLGRLAHLGMRGSLQLRSTGVLTTMVIGGKSDTTGRKTRELKLDTTRNLIEINEDDAAARGTIQLHVGFESREASFGAN
jgi:hypothetical protein